jgi:hypothetical protein
LEFLLKVEKKYKEWVPSLKFKSIVNYEFITTQEKTQP